MANCPTCGKRMLHYENPDRDICPNVSAHAAIQAMKTHSGGKKGKKK